MKKFRDVSIAVKIYGIILIPVVTSMIVGIFSYTLADRLMENQKNFAEISVPSIKGLSLINMTHAPVQKAERTLFVPEFFTDKSEVAHQEENLKKYWQQADIGFETYERIPKSIGTEALWREFKNCWEQWKTSHSEVINFIKAGKRDSAMIVSSGTARTRLRTVEKTADSLLTLNYIRIAELKKSSEDEAYHGKFMLAIIILAGLIVTVLCTLFLTKLIVKPIKRATAVSQSLARGEISVLD